MLAVDTLGCYDNHCIVLLTVDNGRHLRHVFRCCVDLGVGDRNLECPPDCEANQNLVADPFANRGIGVHGVHQSAPSCCQRATEHPKCWYDAEFHQSETLEDRRECKRKDKCQHSDARVDRAAVVDGLEVDGKVIQDREVCSAEEEHESRADRHVALHELFLYDQLATSQDNGVN
jgi:hypothetical protein